MYRDAQSQWMPRCFPLIDALQEDNAAAVYVTFETSPISSVANVSLVRSHFASLAHERVVVETTACGRPGVVGASCARFCQLEYHKISPLNVTAEDQFSTKRLPACELPVISGSDCPSDLVQAVNKSLHQCADFSKKDITYRQGCWKQISGFIKTWYHDYGKWQNGWYNDMILDCNFALTKNHELPPCLRPVLAQYGQTYCPRAAQVSDCHGKPHCPPNTVKVQQSREWLGHKQCACGESRIICVSYEDATDAALDLAHGHSQQSQSAADCSLLELNVSRSICEANFFPGSACMSTGPCTSVDSQCQLVRQCNGSVPCFYEVVGRACDAELLRPSTASEGLKACTSSCASRSTDDCVAVGDTCSLDPTHGCLGPRGRCALARSPDTCPPENCTWLDSNLELSSHLPCVERSDGCSLQRTAPACRASGCGWDASSGVCYFSDCGGAAASECIADANCGIGGTVGPCTSLQNATTLCAVYDDPSLCPHPACTFDFGEYECRATQCHDFATPAQCGTEEACRFDWAAMACFPRDGPRPCRGRVPMLPECSQPCTIVPTDVGPLCTENDESAPCQLYNTPLSCTEQRGCMWDMGRQLCHPNNTCGALPATTCGSAEHLRCVWDEFGHGGLGWCRPAAPPPPQPAPCASHLDPHLCWLHDGCTYNYMAYACEPWPCYWYNQPYNPEGLACPSAPACLSAVATDALPPTTLCYTPNDTAICPLLQSAESCAVVPTCAFYPIDEFHGICQAAALEAPCSSLPTNSSCSAHGCTFHVYDTDLNLGVCMANGEPFPCTAYWAEDCPLSANCTVYSNGPDMYLCGSSKVPPCSSFFDPAACSATEGCLFDSQASICHPIGLAPPCTSYPEPACPTPRCTPFPTLGQCLPSAGPWSCDMFSGDLGLCETHGCIWYRPMRQCLEPGALPPPCGAHYAPPDCNMASGCAWNYTGNNFGGWCYPQDNSSIGSPSTNHSMGPACEPSFAPAVCSAFVECIFDVAEGVCRERGCLDHSANITACNAVSACYFDDLHGVCLSHGEPLPCHTFSNSTWPAAAWSCPVDRCHLDHATGTCMSHTRRCTAASNSSLFCDGLEGCVWDPSDRWCLPDEYGCGYMTAADCETNPLCHFASGHGTCHTRLCSFVESPSGCLAPLCQNVTSVSPSNGSEVWEGCAAAELLPPCGLYPPEGCPYGRCELAFAGLVNNATADSGNITTAVGTAPTCQPLGTMSYCGQFGDHAACTAAAATYGIDCRFVGSASPPCLHAHTSVCPHLVGNWTLCEAHNCTFDPHVSLCHVPEEVIPCDWYLSNTSCPAPRCTYDATQSHCWNSNETLPCNFLGKLACDDASYCQQWYGPLAICLAQGEPTPACIDHYLPEQCLATNGTCTWSESTCMLPALSQPSSS